MDGVDCAGPAPVIVGAAANNSEATPRIKLRRGGVVGGDFKMERLRPLPGDMPGRGLDQRTTVAGAAMARQDAEGQDLRFVSGVPPDQQAGRRTTDFRRDKGKGPGGGK